MFHHFHSDHQTQVHDKQPETKKINLIQQNENEKSKFTSYWEQFMRWLESFDGAIASRQTGHLMLSCRWGDRKFSPVADIRK